MKPIFLFVLFLFIGFSPVVRAESDMKTLYLFYLHFLLVEQIPVQAAELAKGADAEAREEIKKVASQWSAYEITAIRGDLEEKFGEKAKPLFQDFVSGYTTAEHNNDEVYFHSLLDATGVAAANYSELRSQMVDGILKKDVDAGSDFLGEVQTWLDLKSKRQGDVPPLEVWLARNEPTAFPTVETRTENDVPLAEEEYAARKVAAAQAEAESMKHHAEQLAAVEQQTLEQRQNSWKNRLKNIVGTTIGAAGGAFVGVLGTRAGERTADQVFE